MYDPNDKKILQADELKTVTGGEEEPIIPVDQPDIPSPARQI